MPFFNQFEEFDPLTGDVPEYPFSYLSEIAGRARFILRGKAHPQLVAAAKRIDEEIKRYFDDLKYVAVSDLKAKLQADGDPLETYFEWDGGTKANGCWVLKDEMANTYSALANGFRPSDCSTITLKPLIAFLKSIASRHR